MQYAPTAVPGTCNMHLLIVPGVSVCARIIFSSVRVFYVSSSCCFVCHAADVFIARRREVSYSYFIVYDRGLMTLEVLERTLLLQVRIIPGITHDHTRIRIQRQLALPGL